MAHETGEDYGVPDPTQSAPISLREMLELAALLRDDEQVPSYDDMERAAAAIEALVRLVVARTEDRAALKAYQDIPPGDHTGSESAWDRLQAASDAFNAALAQFTDDRAAGSDREVEDA